MRLHTCTHIMHYIVIIVSSCLTL